MGGGERDRDREIERQIETRTGEESWAMEVMRCARVESRLDA